MKTRQRGVIPISIDRRVDKSALPFGSKGKLTTRMVADPYSDTGGSIVVTASLRDDPLARLFARKQIKEHQYAVGHYTQNLFELAEPAGVRAMDFSKEPVDGRGVSTDSGSDAQRRASLRLQQARQCLGTRGYALVRAVLSDRLFIDQVAQAAGMTSERAILFVGARFREALDDLAFLYGFAGEAPPSRAPRDEHSRAAKHAENPKLRAAINLAAELKEAA